MLIKCYSRIKLLTTRFIALLKRVNRWTIRRTTRINSVEGNWKEKSLG